MSQLMLQGKIQLTSAVYNEETFNWDCNIIFNDNSGLFTVDFIDINQILLIDTSSLESGTLTFFRIVSVNNRDVNNSSADVSIEYLWDINDNLTSPDLTYSLGYDGALCQQFIFPGRKQFIGLPSVSIQGLPETFASHLLNYNMGMLEKYIPPPDSYNISIYEPDQLDPVFPSLFRMRTNSQLFALNVDSFQAVCMTPSLTNDTIIRVKDGETEIITIVFGIGSLSATITATPPEVTIFKNSILEIEVVGTPDPDLTGVSIILGFVRTPSTEQ